MKLGEDGVPIQFDDDAMDDNIGLSKNDSDKWNDIKDKFQSVHCYCPIKILLYISIKVF